MEVVMVNDSDFGATLVVGDKEINFDSGEKREITNLLDEGSEHKIYMELIETDSSIETTPHIVIFDEDLDSGDKELFEGDVGKVGRDYSLGG